MLKLKTLQWFGAIRQSRNPTTKATSKGVDFGLAPEDVLTMTGRAPSYADLAVYVAILAHRNKMGIAWMSQSEVARLTNLSRNSVRKSWSWLEAVGLLSPCKDVHVARRRGRQPSSSVWCVFQFPNETVESQVTEDYLEGKIQEVENEPDYQLDEAHVGLVSDDMV